MKYYIGSSSIIDHIISEDGVSISGIAGGAGTYALAGGSLWTDEMYLVSKLSTYQMTRMRTWFKKNNLPTDYIEVIEDNSPVNQIQYFKDGSKKEFQKFKESDLKKFEYRSEIFVEQAQEQCGLYIFRNASEEFWQPYLNMKDKKATILWRIASDACQPAYSEQVKAIADKIDIFSIGFEDGKKLFAVSSVDEVYRELAKFKTPLIILTTANAGMYLIKHATQTFIPYTSHETVEIVDLTGGEDAVSAAVLVGYCQGKNFTDLGLMANHSRILCVQQYGLPDSIREYRNRKFLF